MKAPALLERDFERQVTDFLDVCGWSWMHARAGRTRDSWRVPLSGPLAQGWPDLIAFREKDGRRLALELKREGAKPTLAQLSVLELLDVCGFQAKVVWPKDWPDLERLLR